MKLNKFSIFYNIDLDEQIFKMRINHSRILLGISEEELAKDLRINLQQIHLL